MHVHVQKTHFEQNLTLFLKDLMVCDLCKEHLLHSDVFEKCVCECA